MNRRKSMNDCKSGPFQPPFFFLWGGGTHGGTHAEKAKVITKGWKKGTTNQMRFFFFEMQVHSNRRIVLSGSGQKQATGSSGSIKDCPDRWALGQTNIIPPHQEPSMVKKWKIMTWPKNSDPIATTKFETCKKIRPKLCKDCHFCSG